MPIYEYECPTHGRFEVSQRITEASLSTCTTENCGEPVRKLISQSSFALKGSGWYVSDYGRSGAAGTPAKSEPKAEAKAETKEPAAGCGQGACGAGSCAA